MSEFPQPPRVSLGLPLLIAALVGGLIGGAFGYRLASSALGGTHSAATSASTKTQTLAVQEDSASVDVVQKANPAVVSIIISKDFSKIYGQQPSSPFDNFFGFPLGQQVPQGQQDIGGGSGFIVGSDGLIVTNKHVVDDDQATYTVVMNDGKRYDAKVLAKDPTNDIAIVKIEATGLTTLQLDDSDKVVIGETVIAIGNALGEYRNTVTKGIISGKSRTITAGDSTTGQSETLEDVFQTDAAINPGNSGGPLLNLAGHVIGMNSAVNSSGQLIGFAIPINAVKRDLDSVNASGKIVKPFLGVRYVLVSKALAQNNKLPVDHGALIQADDSTNNPAVVSGSPADKAGLVAGDIIVSLNGTDISTDHTLAGLLGTYNVGDTVTLKVYHQGKVKDVQVKLEERK